MRLDIGVRFLGDFAQLAFDYGLYRLLKRYGLDSVKSLVDRFFLDRFDIDFTDRASDNTLDYRNEYRDNHRT